METIIKNTVFTNVAETSDGGVYWEGMDQLLPEGVTITSWKNKLWSSEDGQFVFVRYSFFRGNFMQMSHSVEESS